MKLASTEGQIYLKLATDYITDNPTVLTEFDLKKARLGIYQAAKVIQMRGQDVEVVKLKERVREFNKLHP